MKIKVIDGRPMIFNKVGRSKTADYDNDEYLRGMEYIANAYDLLKDREPSLEVGYLFGDEILTHIGDHK